MELLAPSHCPICTRWRSPHCVLCPCYGSCCNHLTSHLLRFDRREGTHNTSRLVHKLGDRLRMTVLSIQRGKNRGMHSDNSCDNTATNQHLVLWPCVGALGICDGARSTMVQVSGSGLLQRALCSHHTQGAPS